MINIQIVSTIFVFLPVFSLFVEGARCPGLGNAPTPTALDLERLLGEWKMLKAGPESASSNRSNVDCISYTISENNNSVHFLNLLYRERVDGVVHEDPHLVTVKLAGFAFPSHWDLWSKIDYTPTDVVATDYENYMILYMCNDLEGIRDGVPIWLIFGRETTMDDVMLDTLLWFIEGFGFSRDQFLEIGQANCN